MNSGFKCKNDTDGDGNCHLCFNKGHCIELLAELDKYKKKCTISGDRKPFTVGDTIYYNNNSKLMAAIVEEIVNSPSKALIRISMPPTIITAEECYLDHEAVPEGDANDIF